MHARFGVAAIAAGILAIGVVAPAIAKGGGGHGFGGVNSFSGRHAFSSHPADRVGFGGSTLPRGFSRGGKKGWTAGSPPGWSKGRKKGWSSTVPPGFVP